MHEVAVLRQKGSKSMKKSILLLWRNAVQVCCIEKSAHIEVQTIQIIIVDVIGDIPQIYRQRCRDEFETIIFILRTLSN